jgi:poly-beta-hydroxyalkanoate depolymerase
VIDGREVAIHAEDFDHRVWGNALRNLYNNVRPDNLNVRNVAPLSGQFATLPRGTVAAFVPEHDV